MKLAGVIDTIKVRNQQPLVPSKVYRFSEATFEDLRRQAPGKVMDLSMKPISVLIRLMFRNRRG